MSSYNFTYFQNVFSYLMQSRELQHIDLFFHSENSRFHVIHGRSPLNFQQGKLTVWSAH